MLERKGQSEPYHSLSAKTALQKPGVIRARWVGGWVKAKQATQATSLAPDQQTQKATDMGDKIDPSHQTLTQKIFGKDAKLR